MGSTNEEMVDFLEVNTNIDSNDAACSSSDIVLVVGNGGQDSMPL